MTSGNGNLAKTVLEILARLEKIEAEQDELNTSLSDLSSILWAFHDRIGQIEERLNRLEP